MSKLIINIGRQLGSGGSVIAKKLAEHFHCKFYDREILNLAAKESGFSENLFEQHDEHKSFLSGINEALFPNRASYSTARNGYTQETLFQLQSDAIRKAAAEGNCVFVGRCADYVLRDVPNTVNVFITAPQKDRIARIMHRHGCNEDKALRILRNKEKARASFYNFYTGKRWGDAQSYDLCIDSSLLGIEGTTAIIAAFIEQCFKTTE